MYRCTIVQIQFEGTFAHSCVLSGKYIKLLLVAKTAKSSRVVKLELLGMVFVSTPQQMMVIVCFRVHIIQGGP